MANWKKILLDGDITSGASDLDGLSDFARGTDAVDSDNYGTLMPSTGDMYYRTGQTKPELYVRQGTYIIHKLDFDEWEIAHDFSPATITCTSPTSSSNWYPGTSHYITWTSVNMTEGVQISLYKESGATLDYVIVADTANDGGYTWVIPYGQTPGTAYQIKLAEVGNTVDCKDFTDDFDIPTPTLGLTYPNASGISLSAGTTFYISWTYSGGSGVVKISLMKGGALDHVIIASTGNDGTYTWDIPGDQTAGTDYKIKIEDVNISTSDQSDNNFEIQEATLTLTAPNGGEEWARNEPNHTITWNHTGGSGNVKLTLSKDGGSFDTITNSTANTGSYSWDISNSQTPDENYKVKIEDASNSAMNDVSDADFHIYRIYYPSCTSMWWDNDLSGSLNYSGVIPVGQVKTMYGRCNYNYSTSTWEAGTLHVATPSGDIDGDGNTTDEANIGMNQDHFTNSLSFTVDSDIVGTKSLEYQGNGFQWKGEDDISPRPVTGTPESSISFGQYHVWGGTNTAQDLPDSADLTAAKSAGRYILDITDHNDFGTYQSITHISDGRAFFAIENNLGTLDEFKQSATTDFSAAEWQSLNSTSFSWSNGYVSRTFNVYYTNRMIPGGTYYYKVRAV